MPNLLCPDFTFASLTVVTSAWLQQNSYECIFLDIDNTFVEKGKNKPYSEHLEWLQTILNANIEIVFVSNSKGFAEINCSSLDNLPVVSWAAKPLPIAYYRARKKVRKTLNKNNILVLGDQIFTDILGAHLYGFDAALVKPLPGPEFLVTRIMRKMEQYL